MSRRYRVRHETVYKYAADVMHSHHLLHLVPRPAPYQECLEHEIQIDPSNHHRVDGLDAFGTPLIRLELAQPHRERRVISQMQSEVHARPAVSLHTTDPW
jgi:transglutaminase-like putative cysteine protease